MARPPGNQNPIHEYLHPRLKNSLGCAQWDFRAPDFTVNVQPHRGLVKPLQAPMSSQNRNVPLLTKIEMSPFLVLHLQFRCCSLSLPEAKPCGARRAERLGRSAGQAQRPDGYRLSRADFLTTPLFRREFRVSSA